MNLIVYWYILSKSEIPEIAFDNEYVIQHHTAPLVNWLWGVCHSSTTFTFLLNYWSSDHKLWTWRHTGSIMPILAIGIHIVDHADLVSIDLHYALLDRISYNLRCLFRSTVQCVLHLCAKLHIDGSKAETILLISKIFIPSRKKAKFYCKKRRICVELCGSETCDHIQSNESFMHKTEWIPMPNWWVTRCWTWK